MDETRSDYPFREAAFYYGRFRPPYALEAFEHIGEVFGLGEGVRVLDLGCGPGTIAIPLSRLGAEVTAVDPEEEMLKEGRRLAAARVAGKIDWIRARAEEVISRPGQYRLVTFGQSLHWMDRDFVLRGLASIVGNNGGLAIVEAADGRSQDGRSQESWESIVAPVAARYFGNRKRHPLKHPEVQHEPCLRRSSHFSQFTSRVFPVAFTRDFESILGCVYSGVNARRSELGERARAFETEVCEALARVKPSGLFRERLETVVVVAKKS